MRNTFRNYGRITYVIRIVFIFVIRTVLRFVIFSLVSYVCTYGTCIALRYNIALAPGVARCTRSREKSNDIQTPLDIVYIIMRVIVSRGFRH